MKKLQLDFFAKVDENHASTTHGCIRFQYRFVFFYESLDLLIKSLNQEHLILTRKVGGDRYHFVTQENALSL